MAKTKSKSQNCTTFNIYDFFNSPDTAEYCQSIGHTFNAVESAVIINQSATRTLEEKLEAYRTIIAEYPDMEIPEGNNHEQSDSFHKELGKVITYKEKLLKKFLSTEKDSVYQVYLILYGKEKLNRTNEFELQTFTTCEKATTAVVKYLKKYTKKKDYTLFSSYDCAYIKIFKIYSNKDVCMAVEINNLGQILEIEDNYNIIKEDGSGYFLESFFIDVPVPFKEGDLVEVHPGNHYTVFVLQNIIRDHPYHKDFILKSDTADMTAYFYYERGGNVNYECIHFYPDLRYCRRELEGDQRILKYISLFKKKEIDMCMLLCFQKCIMLDEIIKEIKGHIRNFDFTWTKDKLFEK